MSTHPFELTELGWHPFFEEHFRAHRADELVPARVAVQHRGAYVLYSEAGELVGELAGKLQGDYVRRTAAGTLDFESRRTGRLPTIGDWVAASVRVDEARATIRAVLPRRTAFSRKAPWLETDEQVIAANIDAIFIVTALAEDADVYAGANLRRLERFLLMAQESGARSLILVTKADLRPDAAQQALVLQASLGADVITTSALTGEGLDALEPHVALGATVALIGSSGVGKSTLVNRMLGEERLATREITRDGAGRHTTARRELVRIPGRGYIIDTPGLRELQVWDAEDGVSATFSDIAELARRCRFRDCRHDVEPECAVLEAVEAGALDASRVRNFRKLQRELVHLDAKQSARAAAEVRHKNRAFQRYRRKLPRR